MTTYNVLIIAGQKLKFKRNGNFLTVRRCNFEIPIETSFILTDARRSVRDSGDGN